mmetsp:Transcript_5752/g.11950  ORF Transcript_5752/g.11950 Transcript_5752/m.11950 type:complete len:88 (-) Transcript_5752:979-1242(-)
MLHNMHLSHISKSKIGVAKKEISTPPLPYTHPDPQTVQAPPPPYPPKYAHSSSTPEISRSSYPDVSTEPASSPPAPPVHPGRPYEHP